MPSTSDFVASGSSGPVINDQAASGYFSVGNSLTQWGSLSGQGQSGTVTFPVPFADTNYAVLLEPIGSAAVEHRVSKSAGSFSFEFFSSAGSGLAVGAFNWHAVGRKP